jgi:hypothetical protein
MLMIAMTIMSVATIIIITMFMIMMTISMSWATATFLIMNTISTNFVKVSYSFSYLKLFLDQALCWLIINIREWNIRDHILRNVICLICLLLNVLDSLMSIKWLLLAENSLNHLLFIFWFLRIERHFRDRIVLLHLLVLRWIILTCAVILRVNIEVRRHYLL